MYCSKCGTKFEETDKFCANCGLQNSRKISSRTKWIISIISLSFILIIGIVLVKTQNDPKSIANDTEQKSDSSQNLPLIESTNPVKTESPPTIEKEKTQIIKESMPKVFTILTPISQGSGFLYQEGGYIVTNAHVVTGYTDVLVRNHVGQESPAQVIGISDQSDLALLLVEDYANAEAFSIESEQSVVGTEVIAIGSPQGFENSASIGYLTGTDREMEIDFVYEELYQIDAQIDQGSSGGPLLDAKTGKVIGINSLLYKNNTSFGFSIPLYTVMETINTWISSPMSTEEIAAMFQVYEEYTYEDSSYTEEEEEWNFDDEYWESYSYTFDETSLTYFILSFRDYYELALNYKEFYWIQDMLAPEGSEYEELETLINDITDLDYYYEFLSNEVTGLEIYDDHAIVTNLEEYNFYDGVGKELYFNHESKYTVIITEDGYYEILEIE